MKCLVTGGSGFIGSHLVDGLLELGHSVAVLDDFSLGKEENLAHHKSKKNLKVCKKSIVENLSPFFEEHQFQAIFHLAALPRVQFSIKNPKETHEANVNGTLNLLVAAKDAGVKRFVFSSSSSIYGDQEKLPLTEDMTPNPMSPYALHKLVGEYYCRLFYKIYGLETVSLRYFNVYGPRQNPAGDYACLIPKFIQLIQEGKIPTINGDGKQTRDFTYVTDVVNANILAATTKNNACFSEALNIGGGKNISVNEVTSQIIALSKKKIVPKHGLAVIEPKHTLADVAKASLLLKWQPKVDFEEGLKQTFKYFS